MTKSDRSVRRFETTIELPATRAAVWKALAEAEEIAAWFAPEVIVDPGVGGRVEWAWFEHYRWPLRVETWEPERQLGLAYDSSVDDGDGGKRPLAIEFTLGDGGARGTTTLKLVHSGFGPEADFDSEYDGISRGWPVELESLRLYLGRHAGARRKLALVRREADAPCTGVDLWRRLLAPGALGASRDPEAGLRAGESVRFDLGADLVLDGELLGTPTRHDFCCRVTNLDDGFLHVWLDDLSEKPSAWLALGVYGADAEGIAARFERAFDDVMTRLFGNGVGAS